MLFVARRLRDLHFGKLMEVYIEGNRKKADAFSDPAEGLLQAEQDFYQYLQQVFFAAEGAFYAVWVENGTYCSALRLEPYQDGLLLEALETAPELRRRGYSTKLIQAVQQLPECDVIYSHVSKSNIPSLGVHQLCGFEKMLDYAAYLDGSANRNAVTLRWMKG